MATGTVVLTYLVSVSNAAKNATAAIRKAIPCRGCWARRKVVDSESGLGGCVAGATHHTPTLMRFARASRCALTSATRVTITDEWESTTRKALGGTDTPHNDSRAMQQDE
ncbi:hypothetical protein SAMD00023378_2972 [Ralstonia sp. NT80]|nr:hypothetical protein SAMD00023378_2972 [Ralstonia sp. NT80]